MTEFSRWIFRLQWRTLSVFLLVFVCALNLTATASARKRRRPSKTYPVIRNILINPKNVFDPEVPGEGHWPYTWADVLHITTRERVVRRELLVRPGDMADQDLLDESERILRALPFIKDARIRATPTGDGRVDLVVETHDSWTTEPQIDFGSQGGQNHSAVGVLEENVLGYGKTVSYFYRNDPQGSSREYGYIDPQVWGSRVQLNALVDDTPTGNEQHLTLQRPFYSLTTRMAAGSTWNHIRQSQDVIDNGIQTNVYDQDHNDVDTFWGLRLNRDPLSVHRLSVHYQYYSDFFRPQATTTSLPPNKSISGPALRWDWIQSDFMKETFIDKVERVEDINLGHQMELSAQEAARVFGSTNNTLPFSASDSFGFGHEGDAFALTSFGVTGRYSTYAPRQQGGQLDNTLYFFNGTVYKHLPTEFPFTGVVHFETAYARNIDPENQLALGGDTGLRGFKVQSFTGNKTMLLNLEGRAYYPHEVFHLAYLGGACFVDAGQAEPVGDPFMTRDFHASAGVGMRIALTRSASGSVFRFDVAYALGPIQQDHRIVFSIATGQGFHRNANTYANFPGLPIAQD